MESSTAAMEQPSFSSFKIQLLSFLSQFQDLRVRTAPSSPSIPLQFDGFSPPSFFVCFFLIEQTLGRRAAGERGDWDSKSGRCFLIFFFWDVIGFLSWLLSFCGLGWDAVEEAGGGGIGGEDSGAAGGVGSLSRIEAEARRNGGCGFWFDLLYVVGAALFDKLMCLIVHLWSLSVEPL